MANEPTAVTATARHRSTKPAKPLGSKAYGSIPHLPGSKLGPGDYTISDGQARICTERRRDKHDIIVVQEKLDGSCSAVALLGGQLHALTRKGYPARSSPFEQHHLFADWVDANARRFRSVLNEGERIVGEWIAQAHGTFYPFVSEPFVVFDIMQGTSRLTYLNLKNRVANVFQMPPTLIPGEPITKAEAFRLLHAFKDYCPEGLVYRVERYCKDGSKVDFLAKWVRPGFVPGKYLPELNGGEAVWNWRPPCAP